jgi:hypothetical protein
MHQGKDGLAFVEAFLAQKLYLRGDRAPALLPGLRVLDQRSPLLLGKQAIKQYINSGLQILVCHFLTSLLHVTLEIIFDIFWCIKY